MKKLWNEFKEFALKGNMIDLAVGMIIGAAFTSVISSLVSDVFTPLIAAIIGVEDFGSGLVCKVGSAEINFGSFISNLINFILMAIVVFLFVKGINKLRNLKKEEAVEEAPKTKICPFCKSEIPIDAVKCPHCISDLSE